MNTQASHDLNGDQKPAGIEQIRKQELHAFRGIHDGMIFQIYRKEKIQFKTKLQSDRSEIRPEKFDCLPHLVSGIASQTSGGLTEETIIETTISRPDSRTFESGTKERNTMSAKNEEKLSFPSNEEIAAAAHLIWEKEGRPNGRDLQDWLEAEAQLLADRQHEASAIKRLPVGKPLVAVKAAVEAAIKNRKPRVANRFHAERLAA